MNYNTEHTIKTYNMTPQQAELAQTAYDNLNTELGFKAYFELEQLTKLNKLNDAILYDLAADFDWDNKLANAIEKLAKSAYGLIVNTYYNF